MNMMAMSLYGGSGGGSGGSPYLPFASAPVNPKLASNHIERGSRKLPRPKRSRRKKQREVSLYPSVSAVEEAVPEAIISFHDNGTFEISLTKDGMNEETKEDDAAGVAATEGDDPAAGDDAMEDTEDDERKPPALSFPSGLSFPGSMGDNVISSPLPFERRTSISSQSSMSSSSSLNQEFRKLSVKRKPVASAPWPMDDDDSDPLGGILSTAPRRKVSRHSSRESEHSRGSWGSLSGDSNSIGSQGSGSHSNNNSGIGNTNTSNDNTTKTTNRHRRTATCDSIPSDTETTPTTPSERRKQKAASKHKHRSHQRKSATAKAKKQQALESSSQRRSSAPLRRMKSWGDDESNSTDKRAPQELEVEPGFFLPLRGSDETLAAIKTGFVEELFCQGCDIELICIADVSMCVCPDCKCVTPVDGIAALSSSSKSKYTKGSVGLGLRANK